MSQTLTSNIKSIKPTNITPSLWQRDYKFHNHAQPSLNPFRRSRHENPAQAVQTLSQQQSVSRNSLHIYNDFPGTCQGWKEREHVLVCSAENLLHMRAKAGRWWPSCQHSSSSWQWILTSGHCYVKNGVIRAGMCIDSTLAFGRWFKQEVIRMIAFKIAIVDCSPKHGKKMKLFGPIKDKKKFFHCNLIVWLQAVLIWAKHISIIL